MLRAMPLGPLLRCIRRTRPILLGTQHAVPDVTPSTNRIAETGIMSALNLP
jgi:hypothetical protein